MEENFSMEDFAAMLDQSFHKVYNGDIVEGKIIEKDEKGLMVDVASYMDGVLPVEELLYDGESYDDYQVGDTVRAMVKYVDSREGQIHLSKKEADKLGIWDDLKKLQEEESSRLTLRSSVRSTAVCGSSTRRLKDFCPPPRSAWNMLRIRPCMWDRL